MGSNRYFYTIEPIVSFDNWHSICMVFIHMSGLHLPVLFTEDFTVCVIFVIAQIVGLPEPHFKV